MALKLDLPKPVFAGTPKQVPPGTRVFIRKGKRKPFLVPPGLSNVARGKPVTASDMEPIIGELAMVTDGDKAGSDGHYVELGPGLQWVQIDLKRAYRIHAVVVWHYHGDPRVYYGVVVQVARDTDCLAGVKTIFNNDYENITGLGVGKDRQYFETYEGHLIDAKGVEGRYLRLYSKGSIADAQNHYVEVEVYGKPAKNGV